MCVHECTCVHVCVHACMCVCMRACANTLGRKGSWVFVSTAPVIV